MYLVDTSVWIETFRARDPLRLEDVVELDEIATCALRNHLTVLHRDRDYALLTRVAPLMERCL